MTSTFDLSPALSVSSRYFNHLQAYIPSLIVGRRDSIRLFSLYLHYQIHTWLRPHKTAAYELANHIPRHLMAQ